RFFGAVAEADHPVAGAFDVIGDFLRGLRGDSREARVARALERVESELVPRIEQELPRDRIGEVAVGLLGDEEVAEFAAVAQERELVLVATLAREPRLDLARVREPHPRLAKQIE